MITIDKRDNTLRNIKLIVQLLVCLISVISVLTTILLALDQSKPHYYKYIFLLPLTYAMCVVCFRRNFMRVIHNLGAMLITILMFVRNVLSPLCMYLGNYESTIILNIENNTSLAIMLVIYETLVLFFVMYFSLTKKEKIVQKKDVTLNRIPTLFSTILVILILMFLICNAIVPKILSSYRTIFQIRDEFFTHFEEAQLVNKYGTTFIKKLALVVGRYLANILILLIPAYGITAMSKHKNKAIYKVFAVCLCAMPLFFIGGAIARSLIYFIVLYMYFLYTFKIKRIALKILVLLLTGGGIVILYWVYISMKANIDLNSFSRKFSAYFSGVNIVSGVFNLPNSFEYKLRYFVYDFTSTLPFGNTIFNIKHITVQKFFNLYNQTTGQIPPTLGMGHYYFGYLLAPTYSVLFAMLAIKQSKKIGRNIDSHPFQTIIAIALTIVFSMGIIMYNIEITMTSLFTMYIPLIIFEKIGYKKINNKKVTGRK